MGVYTAAAQPVVGPGRPLTDGGRDAITSERYRPWPAVDDRRALKTRRRRGIMKVMAKAQTNGHLKRLSPKELAEITHPPKYETVEERRAALKRATSGLRVNVRVTRDMYGLKSRGSTWMAA
jgi:hypothetical protein